jgi:hypothetical protein
MCPNALIRITRLALLLEARIHRGVNTGTVSYEEVVIVFLSGGPGMNPQPEPA